MIVDDYPVRPLSNTEIERSSAAWRKELNEFFLGNTLDVIAMFKKARLLLNVPVEVEARPVEAMGRANAYVSKDRTMVFVRQSLVDGAAIGDGDSIFDAVHELAHLVLHPEGLPLARMIDGNIEQKFIPVKESAEHQANYFARAFLMTSEEAARYPTAEALSESCFTPIRHAVTRLKDISRMAPRTPSTDRKADRIWNSARISTAHDPQLFRLSRGNFLVERSKHLHSDHYYGWFADHDCVVSYLEHFTD